MAVPNNSSSSSTTVCSVCRVVVYLVYLHTINFDAPPLTNRTQYVLTQRWLRRRFDDGDDEYCASTKKNKNDFVRKLYYEREPVVAIHHTTTASTCVSVCEWVFEWACERGTAFICVSVSVCVKHYHYVLYEPLVYTSAPNVYVGLLVYFSYMCPSYAHNCPCMNADRTTVCLSHSSVWTSNVFICEDRISTRGFFLSLLLRSRSVERERVVFIKL